MYEDLLATAVSAARRAAPILLRHFRRDGLEVRTKARHDFVTQADEESEAAILEVLRRAYPEHAVLAEEGGAQDPSGGADHQWLVDPLDGTTNFLQGLPAFAISIACRRGLEVVAGAILEPVGDNLFTATRGGGAFWNGRRIAVSRRSELHGAFLATGYPWRAREALDLYLGAFREVFLEARAIRRMGAAALDLAYTAAGSFDGFFEFRLSPWDLAAGCLLVEEAGGRVSDLDGGREYLEKGSVVAGGSLQPALLAAVARHADETRLAEALREVTAQAAEGGVR